VTPPGRSHRPTLDFCRVSPRGSDHLFFINCCGHNTIHALLGQRNMASERGVGSRESGSVRASRRACVSQTARTPAMVGRQPGPPRPPAGFIQHHQESRRRASSTVTEFTGFSLTLGRDQAGASVCNQSAQEEGNQPTSQQAGPLHWGRSRHTKNNTTNKNRIPPWRSACFPAVAVHSALACASPLHTR
jgi:hypothetical protein